MGLGYKDLDRIVCICVSMRMCVLYTFEKRKRGKNFGEEKKNLLKYNVLSVSNADVKKVDEDYFLSHSEKDDSIYIAREFTTMRPVENRLRYILSLLK